MKKHNDMRDKLRTGILVTKAAAYIELAKCGNIQDIEKIKTSELYAWDPDSYSTDQKITVQLK